MWCTYNPSSDGGSNTMQIPSKLSEGASGGPWVTNLSINVTKSGRNVVFGVNSHIFPGKLAMYSPVLGDLAAQLFGKATGKRI